VNLPNGDLRASLRRVCRAGGASSSGFSIITRQAIRPGSFASVHDLVDTIRAIIDGWNECCHPFAWTKTADQILPHATSGQRT
jgi:hypothetical protein